MPTDAEVGDVLSVSAATVGSALPVLVDVLAGAPLLGLVALADELPAPLDGDELTAAPAFAVAAAFDCDSVDVPVDGVLCDPPEPCVEDDGLLDAPSDDLDAPSDDFDVPSDEVPDPAFDAEPVLPLLDDDEDPPEPSDPVPSAWAMPEPLARAAPTPRVIAPAPSQPWATRGCGLARCRPLTRRELPPAAVFARCPPATPTPVEIQLADGLPITIAAKRRGSRLKLSTGIDRVSRSTDRTRATATSQWRFVDVVVRRFARDGTEGGFSYPSSAARTAFRGTRVSAGGDNPMRCAAKAHRTRSGARDAFFSNVVCSDEMTGVIGVLPVLSKNVGFITPVSSIGLAIIPHELARSPGKATANACRLGGSQTTVQVG